MRLLITGANGQVGQALTLYAKQRGANVFAYHKQQLDISSASMIITNLHRHQPDVVINAAAYTHVDAAESLPEIAEKINQEAVGILAQACDAMYIPLLHLSTDYVFSGEKTTPYVETDATVPCNVYGATKLAGEKQLMTLAKKFIIVRTSWVFSATGHNFVKTMLKLFREKTMVSVVNDQWGGPTSAEAIAQALFTIAMRVLEPDFDDWGLYHFSGQPAASWYDFACALRHAYASEPMQLQQLRPIATTEFPTQAIRPAYTVLALQKIYDVFAIMPNDWQKDLSSVIQQLKNIEKNHDVLS